MKNINNTCAGYVGAQTLKSVCAGKLSLESVHLEDAFSWSKIFDGNIAAKNVLRSDLLAMDLTVRKSLA